MIRIVQIGSYPQSSACIRGGVEASVYGLSQEQGKDAEVHVFDIPRIGGKCEVVRDRSVTVHRYCNEGKRQVSTARMVVRIVEEICMLHPDVCHIHGTSLFAWLMYRKLKKKNVKLVVTIHGLVLVEKRILLKKKFSFKRLVQCLYQGMVEKKFLSQLSMAIMDTEYVQKKVEQYPILRKPKMYVIPQGINERFFTMNCSEHSAVFLSVGAFGERKGHLMTIDAFERIRRVGVEAQLAIAGTVADQTYYEAMKHAVAQSEFRSDIILYADLQDVELNALYESAHIFVLHSEEESQGIVLAEAMAVGLPVVSTKVGGIPNVVEDGVTGILSDYGDVSAFEESMKRLMTDATLWSEMSQASRKSAESYHWATIAMNVMQVYDVTVKMQP